MLPRQASLAGRFLERAISTPHDLTYAGATPPQLAVADFLDRVGYARHLRRVRPACRDQIARMRHAVVRHFPPCTRVS